MLTMVCIKKRENRGAGRAEMSVRTRRAAKGAIVSEKYLSKKKSLLFTGEAGSNKSRTLNRIYKNHNHLYPNRPALMISAFSPIAAWVDHKGFNKWLIANRPEATTQWAKLDALPEYVAETKAVVYIDDAHKLSGRKMHTARRLLDAASKWNITTASINRMPPTLRLIADTSRVEMVKLSTHASYDATKALIFLALIGLAITGAWEAAIVVGLMTQLASGRNAGKQD